MKRLIGLAVLAALIGCGDDSTVTETRTGSPNGGRCLATLNGAEVCAGTVCHVNEAGDQIGICSEECSTGCRFGGDCVVSPGDGTLCLKRCETSTECGDHAVCQGISGAESCTADGCVETGSRSYCIPLS